MKYSLSLLLIVSCLYYRSSAQLVLNIASGIFSKKTVSNGLSLQLPVPSSPLLLSPLTFTLTSAVQYLYIIKLQ